jgi:hypothetical protein
MQQVTIILLFLLITSSGIQAQGLDAFLKKAKITSDTTKKQGKLLEVIYGSAAKKGTLANEEIANGLKEALTNGVKKGAEVLAKPDGFFANAALKILMPPDAKKIETTLRNMGMSKQVDEAILSMNRAAEDACKSAAPIFVSAIKEMTITDAMGILKGTDTAATAYLQQKTNLALANAFRPSIEKSLEKTNATKYWNTLITAYNGFSLKKINPDLAGYVTAQSMNGIYNQIASEEKDIRKNPLARSSELLKKVFGN